MKKIFAAIVTTGMAAVLGCMSVSASEIILDDEVKNQEDIQVEGYVSETNPGSPSYVVKIPSGIDFGKLQIPSVNTDNFKEVDFDVELVSMENVGNGSGVCVLVSDANNHLIGTESAQPESDEPFQIKKGEESEAIALDYSLYLKDAAGNITTNLFDNGTWYSNGFLYGVFGHDAQPESLLSGRLRLNQKQLYNRSDEDLVGRYIGKLRFYTTIGNITDVR